ncbi:MAG TPA: universal stress protein [Microlunatus sp.]|jgi:nucleotide-binding universal stress UspA family protein|nr:universal stress protein [Microlunatus sp.]
MIMNCVIVGLDDSAASRAPLQWAAVYADATSTDLCAVHILDWPIGLTAAATTMGTRLHVPLRDVAEPYLRGMHRVFADVDCPDGSTMQFAQGDVGDVLVRLSAHATLLVVGTREPFRGRPYPAGSISHYCMSHAACPVVTVPEQLPVRGPESCRRSQRALHPRQPISRRHTASQVTNGAPSARRLLVENTDP